MALAAGQHHGFAPARRRIGAFTLTETRYKAGLTTPWHAHQRDALCLVLDGKYAERFRHKTVDCTPTTVLLRPAEAEHDDVVGKAGARCFIVEPDAGWLRRHDFSRLADGAPLHSHQTRASWLMLKVREEFRIPDAMSELAVESLLVAAIVDLARVKTVESSRRQPAAWLIRVRDGIHDAPERHVSLATLAADAGVHPVHLAMRFRTVFGVTVGEYFRRCRVEAARRALSGPFTISRIALELGFANPSHFAHVFAGQVGCSPGAYRRSLRTN